MARELTACPAILAGADVDGEGVEDGFELEGGEGGVFGENAGG